MRTFKLPDLGEGLHDAEIVSWHVAVGQRVVADQPLVSVETEKAIVEIPAPWSGVITNLYANPGDVVAIGGPLADVEERAPKDPGAVVGDLSKSGSDRMDEEAAVSAPAKTADGIKAAPAVRKLAGELGVDIERIAGSGPDGVVTRQDVERVAANGAGGSFEPLSGVRRTMARRMAQAQHEVATTLVTDEANVTHWARDEDATIRLVRAVIAACAAEPALNAWFDGARLARRLHSRIDLGIALNTGEGLFVPVLRDVAARSAEELRQDLEVLKTEVAARTISAQSLRGQTITLSNFGMMGGKYASLIVMPPQVAIIGAGRITPEARVTNGEIGICRVLPLSLTFDHRALTGAEATRFLMAMIAELEA